MAAPVEGDTSHFVRRIPSWDERRYPDESEVEYLLRLVLINLQTLAADAETCIRAYPSSVPVADDLANDFDTHVEQLEWVAPSGSIPRDVLAKIRAVNAKLDEMSGPQDPDLWSEEGLRTRAEWIVIRRLAREAVEALGYEPEPPPPWSGRTYFLGRVRVPERLFQWLNGLRNDLRRRFR